MSIKSSINKVSNIRILFFSIFLIITKIECWPVFKQDPAILVTAETKSNFFKAFFRFELQELVNCIFLKMGTTFFRLEFSWNAIYDFWLKFIK